MTEIISKRMTEQLLKAFLIVNLSSLCIRFSSDADPVKNSKQGILSNKQCPFNIIYCLLLVSVRIHLTKKKTKEKKAFYHILTVTH